LLAKVILYYRGFIALTPAGFYEPDSTTPRYLLRDLQSQYIEASGDGRVVNKAALRKLEGGPIHDELPVMLRGKLYECDVPEIRVKPEWRHC